MGQRRMGGNQAGHVCAAFSATDMAFVMRKMMMMRRRKISQYKN